MTRHLTDTLKLSIRKETKERAKDEALKTVVELLYQNILSLEARILTDITEYSEAELSDFVESARFLNHYADKKFDVSHVEQYIQTL